MRKSKNRNFYHIFVSHGDAPGAITLNVVWMEREFDGWKENSMLTNCLAACAHLTITVSEIQRDICEKVVILSYPLAFDAPLGGFPSEYRHPIWDGKPRMVSLPDGEKISKISLFVLTWSTNVTDGRTDRRTDRQTLRDSIDRACIASRGKNSAWNDRRRRWRTLRDDDATDAQQMQWWRDPA